MFQVDRSPGITDFLLGKAELQQEQTFGPLMLRGVKA